MGNSQNKSMQKQREPNDDPHEFRIGDKVRIYSAYLTDTQVYVREGIVLNTEKKKEDLIDGLALELRVERVGRVLRTDPVEVIVRNVDGYWVRGRLGTGYKRFGLEDVKKPYRRSYFYRCISGAEKI